MVLRKGKRWFSKLDAVYPPIESLRLRKLSPEARFQTRMRLQQAGAARRIPVRLRESRRAPLVALVGSGWENERSWVAHVYILPAERTLNI